MKEFQYISPSSFSTFTQSNVLFDYSKCQEKPFRLCSYKDKDLVQNGLKKIIKLFYKYNNKLTQYKWGKKKRKTKDLLKI